MTLGKRNKISHSLLQNGKSTRNGEVGSVLDSLENHLVQFNLSFSASRAENGQTSQALNQHQPIDLIRHNTYR